MVNLGKLKSAASPFRHGRRQFFEEERGVQSKSWMHKRIRGISMLKQWFYH